MRYFIMHRYPISIPFHQIRGVVCGLHSAMLPSEPLVRALQSACSKKLRVDLASDRIFPTLGMATSAQIRDVLSLPSSQIQLKRQANDADILVVRTEYERLLREYYTTYGVSFVPGVEDALRTLRINGILFGGTSPLSENVLDIIRMGMPREREGLASSGHMPPRPVLHTTRSLPIIPRMLDIWNNSRRINDNIKKNEVLYVGDTVHDLDEAKASKMHFVAAIGPKSKSSNCPVDCPKIELEHLFRQHGASMIVNDLQSVATTICVQTLS